MQNTLAAKKSVVIDGVTRSEDPDGTIVLNFIGNRFREKNNRIAAFIFMALISIAVCFGIYVVSRGDGAVTFVVGMFAIFLISKFVPRVKEVIKIKPNAGIQFLKHSVPFSDISRIYIEGAGQGPFNSLHIISNNNDVIVCVAKPVAVRMIYDEVLKATNLLKSSN